MATTTSFDEWFGMGNEPDGHEDLYDLFHASRGEGLGTYSVSTKGDQTFIKGPSGDTLLLASSIAAKAFGRTLEGMKSDPEMDFESWIGFKRAIAKDD
jgi:hypothetical protein